MLKLFRTLMLAMFLFSVNFSTGYAAEPAAERDNSAEIRKAVESYFEKENFTYSGFNEKNVASISFNVESKISSVRIRFQAQKNMLLIRAMLPIKANEDVRPAVAEYLLRANYGMKIGGFDFDFNDGELSFRASFYCGDVAPTHEQIDYAIKSCVVLTQRYGDGLLKVIFGLQSPKDAIQEIDGSKN